MNSKQIKKLVISRFASLVDFKNHQNDDGVRDGLNLVPLDLDSYFNWKCAFSGRFTNTGSIICTFPRGWREGRVLFDFGSLDGQDGTAGYLNSWYTIYPETIGYNNIFQELVLRLDSYGNLYLDGRGYKDDGSVLKVYYR